MDSTTMDEVAQWGEPVFVTPTDAASEDMRGIAEKYADELSEAYFKATNNA